MLQDVTWILICPICQQTHEESLHRHDGVLRCSRGHTFDIARQGYVNLQVAGSTKADNADSPAMVQARSTFLDRKGYRPLTDRLAHMVAEAAPRVVADSGAGTGHHLARVLDRIPPAVGLALDLSKHASRRAARAHPRIGAVVADLRQSLPIRSGSVDVVLDVFSPRNAAEFARVVSPHGQLLVATPTVRHLADLVRPLDLVSVDTQKQARLAAAFEDRFALVDDETCEFELVLQAEDAELAVRMGPSAHHIEPAELRSRIRRLLGTRDSLPVLASVQLTRWRPKA